MPSIEDNKKYWNKIYHWKEGGEEWKHAAFFCNQPYKKWKDSIAKNFILKNTNENSTILEIGVGHGRWTTFILKRYKKIILIDLSQLCINFCKKEFSRYNNIEYYRNDGRKLDFVSDNSIDFIWSFDTFVHLERKIVDSYFKEFKRILKPNGFAIIHHSGRNNLALNLKFLKKFGKCGIYIYQVLSLGKFSGGGGWRSDVSKEMIRDLVIKNGLSLEYQINSWGKDERYNIKLSNDYISKIVKK